MDLKRPAQSIMTILEHLEGPLLSILGTSPRIAILASGGLASNTLLAASLEICRRHELENSWLVLAIPMANNSWEHAGRTCEWASQRWNTMLPMLRLGDPSRDQRQAVVDACAMAVRMDLSNAYLLGSTAATDPADASNPPAMEFGETVSNRVIRPWINHTKDHVVGLISELGLREVMELSHCCSVTRATRCGACWSCRERARAFGKAGIVDIGKL